MMLEPLNVDAPGFRSPKGKATPWSPVGTPLSQASTAPPSPMASCCLGDFMMRQISNESAWLGGIEEDQCTQESEHDVEKDGITWMVTRGAPPSIETLESSLTEVKSLYKPKFGEDVEAEDSDGEERWAQAMVKALYKAKFGKDVDAEDSDGEEGEHDEEILLDEELLGMTPLGSELGLWAQAQVGADAKAGQDIVAIGMPALQSELGRWAQAMVQAEEWLVETLNRQRFAAGPKQYLVESQALRACTDGLAFRPSKNLWDRGYEVAGPAWGSVVQGICHADGWLQVDDGRFLPTIVDGLVVLRRVEVFEGPALTADGRVLQLGDGTSVCFAFDGRASAGIESARIRKDWRDLVQARRVEEGAAGPPACAIDTSGTIHGSLLSRSDLKPNASRRVKLFHRKKQARRTQEKKQDIDGTVLCTSQADGSSCT